MNAQQLDTVRFDVCQLTGTLRWEDADTGYTMIASTPAEEPRLWQRYLQGAERSYRKHGVDKALDVAAVENGHDTDLFFAAVDENGAVKGGVRATGPLLDVDQSHAVVEWAGHPGLAAVEKMIADRLPFGVVEMKTAWATSDSGKGGLLAQTLARTAFPTMALLDSQFVLATAASHVLDRWRSSGGVVAAKVPAAPYPDDRYRTRMMWWDRQNFTKHAEPKQVSKILQEMMHLNRVVPAQEALTAAGSLAAAGQHR